MILIPQRLFDDPRVSTILRDGNVCILSKELFAAANQQGMGRLDFAAIFKYSTAQ